MARQLTVDGEAAPDLMDRVYRHQRHIYDLSRRYFLLGRDHLIARLAPPPGGHVLELGCGTGRNLIAAARRFPNAHFHGLDLSGQMLATARRKLARARLAQRVQIARGDATGFDPEATFGRSRFDRVFFSYSLSMMPPWQIALAHAAELVAPGGRLAVVDFGQQEQLPDWVRPMLHGWLARFHVTPRARFPLELEHLAVSLPACSRFTRLHRGYAWYAELRLPA